MDYSNAYIIQWITPMHMSYNGYIIQWITPMLQTVLEIVPLFVSAY